MIDDHCDRVDMNTGSKMQDIPLLSSFGNVTGVIEDNGLG